MTEQNPVSPEQSDPDGQTATPQGGSTADAENGNEKPMPREQRYRLQLREAEGQRDALQARVDAMNRREVERLAADGMSHPADLFSLSGNDLADYLTEDGDVDAEKVAADVAAILAERPGLRKMTPGYDPSQGLGGRPPKGSPSFGDLLKS
ncbi:hypothetical protein [Mycolicibacterium pyrenivorans]|uniref:hypothetical protein n=1 Tax=Mycolicibacterium pyrenivorans TaxID=187102 RepID=UPI0021F2C7C4|nr:hypothetical protein [Mycolicibacterium pyrenivorans]MCV7150681.1 hypothetical protein [Mycolicibacterium pyrenivorans]